MGQNIDEKHNKVLKQEFDPFQVLTDKEFHQWREY